MNINRRLAFSLVELLVVVAVIAIVVGFAVPAANNLLRGSQITQGSQQLGDQLAFARQSALSRNRSVEVRFYRYGDLDTPGENTTDKTTWHFRAFQLFEIMENGAALPINKMVRLPKMVSVDSDKYSTLLRIALRGAYKDATKDLTTPEIPVSFNNVSVGRNYEYASFRFLQEPDASRAGGYDIVWTNAPNCGPLYCKYFCALQQPRTIRCDSSSGS